jgi:hypothetical protein
MAGKSAKRVVALDVPAIHAFVPPSDTKMAGTSPAMMVVNTIGFEEVTANSYFFAGAIVESLAASGLTASGLASALAAVSAV